MLPARRFATTALAHLTCLGALLSAPASSEAQAGAFGPYGPRLPVYSTERRDEVPHWLELPREARIRTGDGIALTPLHNSAMSLEHLKLGILVGALRNDGACAANLSARLQYVDQSWKPMGPAIPNEARVSQVEPGGLMPFRFRLRNIGDSKVAPSAYLVIIEADDDPIADPYTWSGWVSSADATDRSPCAPSPTTMKAEVTKRQPLRQGFLLEGTVTLVEGNPVRADGIVVTAVLRDEKTEVLDVLAGTPRVRPRDVPTGVIQGGDRLEFRLLSDMPLGKDVASVDVMVEVLPDAVLAAPKQP